MTDHRRFADRIVVATPGPMYRAWTCLGSCGANQRTDSPAVPLVRAQRERAVRSIPPDERAGVGNTLCRLHAALSLFLNIQTSTKSRHATIRATVLDNGTYPATPESRGPMWRVNAGIPPHQRYDQPGMDAAMGCRKTNGDALEKRIRNASCQWGWGRLGDRETQVGDLSLRRLPIPTHR